MGKLTKLIELFPTIKIFLQSDNTITVIIGILAIVSIGKIIYNKFIR